MKVGLALSGGGARGMVHVGVIQALIESGIPIDIISGTSAGAIVGSLYAAGYAPAEILGFIKEQNLIRIFNLRVPKKGFARHSFLRKQLVKFLPGNSFDELSIPLSVTVANISTGLPESYQEGPLIDYVVASSSIPVLFEPVRIGNEMYLDGGLLMNLPASPVRANCDVLIGVSLVPRITVPDSELTSVFGIGGRCFDLAALNNIKPEIEICDMVIEPPELSQFSRFSMSHAEQLYQIGYREVLDQMENVKSLVYRGIPGEAG
jgi:NTE family protein